MAGKGLLLTTGKTNESGGNGLVDADLAPAAQVVASGTASRFANSLSAAVIVSCIDVICVVTFATSEIGIETAGTQLAVIFVQHALVIELLGLSPTAAKSAHVAFPPVRALEPTASTQLLIDVRSKSGKYGPSATVTMPGGRTTKAATAAPIQSEAFALTSKVDSCALMLSGAITCTTVTDAAIDGYGLTDTPITDAKAPLGE